MSRALSTGEAKKAEIEGLLEKLSSNKNGLSSSDAKKRLQEYGPNEIIEKKSIL